MATVSGQREGRWQVGREVGEGFRDVPQPPCPQLSGSLVWGIEGHPDDWRMVRNSWPLSQTASHLHYLSGHHQVPGQVDDSLEGPGSRLHPVFSDTWTHLCLSLCISNVTSLCPALPTSQHDRTQGRELETQHFEDVLQTSRAPSRR